jgi:uncharacterized protein (DUF1800 family)
MTGFSIALDRFGLGARADEDPPRDPRKWVADQLHGFDPRPPAIAAAPARGEVATQLADYLEQQRAVGRQRLAQRPQALPAAVSAIPAAMQNGPAAMQSEPATVRTGAAQPAMNDRLAGLPDATRQFIRKAARDYYLTSVAARTNAALVTPTPFVERLVHFWANHFAVSADKLTVIGLSGLLEFEAIRPHVLGRFGDMLLAVEQHPAMLLYLDQAQSIGPDSIIGARAAARGGSRRAGLNENLAREIMELHTLGVRTGYSQADVVEFARALTGWTVAGLGRGGNARFLGIEGAPGSFAFAARLHEPGVRTILGRRYDQPGVEQARAVLADLAASPATARHIATKLARHFAADDPPPTLVDRLSAAWLKSGGDLPSVYRVLIVAPEIWERPATKFRNPWDWTIAALRGIGAREIQGQAVAGVMNQLGQPVWRPGSPAGYDDIAASWAGPDALVRRVEAAQRIAARAGNALDARQLAPKLLADAMTPATAQALARAESPGQGLALLLASPEFLRR